MTPEDKKKAKCTNCEFYHNNVNTSMPLGWCRNGYGRAIDALPACPKQVAKEQARKEKEALKPIKLEKPKAKSLPAKKKRKPCARKETVVPVVVVKAKKTTIKET